MFHVKLGSRLVGSMSARIPKRSESRSYRPEPLLRPAGRRAKRDAVEISIGYGNRKWLQRCSASSSLGVYPGVDGSLPRKWKQNAPT